MKKSKKLITLSLVVFVMSIIGYTYEKKGSSIEEEVFLVSFIVDDLIESPKNSPNYTITNEEKIKILERQNEFINMLKKIDGVEVLENRTSFLYIPILTNDKKAKEISKLLDISIFPEENPKVL